jgi:hypothetical protein
MSKNIKDCLIKINCLQSNDFLYIPREYLNSTTLKNDLEQDTLLLKEGEFIRKLDISFSSNELLDFYEIYRYIMFEYDTRGLLKFNINKLQHFIQISSYFGCNFNSNVYNLFNKFFNKISKLFRELTGSLIIPQSLKLNSIEYLGFMFNEYVLMLENISSLENKLIKKSCEKRYDRWFLEEKISMETYAQILDLIKYESKHKELCEKYQEDEDYPSNEKSLKLRDIKHKYFGLRGKLIKNREIF